VVARGRPTTRPHEHVADADPSSGFASVEQARSWVALFVAWYNHEHQHSGIGYVTPAERHAGDDVAILTRRRATYARARSRPPERWARHTRPWSRPTTVTLNPEVDHSKNTRNRFAS
jgi:putative transposase